MDRRKFTVGSGMTAAAALAVSPARGQGGAQVRWRMASSFPRTLGMYQAAEIVAKRVEALTGGQFQIRVFPPGEIVPGLQVLDAVEQGTIECGYTAGYYYGGKESALAIDTCLPFGMGVRQHNAWMLNGGGLEGALIAFPQLVGTHAKKDIDTKGVEIPTLEQPGYAPPLFGAPPGQ